MIALFLILLIVVLGATFGVSGVIIIIASAIGLLFFFCIKWSIEEKQKEKERSARQAAEQDNQKLRNFYQMCKKAGVTAIQSEEDLQIITQIAGTMQLGDADAKTFFLEASALAQKERREKNEKARRKREAELETLRNEERQRCAELGKYADYSGREKRLAMLHDQYKKTSKGAYQMSQGYSALTMPPVATPRDADWAIHGGIASGLAGSAAGLATAMDIQRQNAENRARADAINSTYVSSLVHSGILERVDRERRDLEDEAEELLYQIQKTGSAMVADISAEKCLDMLKFEEAEITVSKTGTCHVTAQCILKEKLVIYNNLDAVVDGTVLAEICDGKNSIGTAKLVLPLEGVDDCEPVKLEGIALFCGQPRKKYTVRYKANNLFAIEYLPYSWDEEDEDESAK